MIVTLEEANKAYRLSDLIADADANPDPVTLANTTAQEIYLQAHPENTGTIYGDSRSDVNTLSYGYTLTPTGEARVYALQTGCVTTTSKWLFSDKADQQLLVELVQD